MQLFYKTALALHYIGFVTMAGTLLANYMAYRQFWKVFSQDPQKALILQQATKKFPLMIGIGGILILCGGISMMTILHATIGTQLWFRVKMILVVLLIINGTVMGGRSFGKLQRTLNGEKPLSEISVEGIRKRINFFLISQLSILLLIFILSAFRFN